MLAIHGIWAYGALCLWAEDADGPATAQRRPGRPSRAPRPHPFAAAADVIADAVAELAEPVAEMALKAVDDELTLWLPARADGPLPSPELFRSPESQPATGTGRAALAAWRVPALTFEPSAGLDLLSVLGESRALGARAGSARTGRRRQRGWRQRRERHRRRRLRRQVAARAVRRRRAAGA